MDLIAIAQQETISSIELVDKINEFRAKENKSELLHKNFLQVIRDEFEEEINQLKIQPVTYKDKKGEARLMFELTYSQAKQLLVRESKVVRKAIIKYIEELEAKFNNPTYIMKRALEVADREIEKLQLTTKIQEQQLLEYEPKVTYYDHILQCTNVVSATQIAKDYGMSAVRLNFILHQQKVQYKMNNQWLLYQQHANKGYTQTKTSNRINHKGEPVADVHTYWTQKGRLFINDVLNKIGIVANVDKESI